MKYFVILFLFAVFFVGINESFAQYYGHIESREFYISHEGNHTIKLQSSKTEFASVDYDELAQSIIISVNKNDTTNDIISITMSGSSFGNLLGEDKIEPTDILILLDGEEQEYHASSMIGDMVVWEFYNKPGISDFELVEKPSRDRGAGGLEDTSFEEHYEIEIFGLKDEYMVGEEYSFYYVISGYGHSCANHQASYPDENGNIIHVGAEVLCAPEKLMHEFNFNPLEGKRTLGNTGIKKPGTYSITVTFEKPSKYYPTTTTKEFRVVEAIAENFIELSPLKQIKAGISIEKIQCRENFVLVQKYDDSPACVKFESILPLLQRGWASEIEETSMLAFELVRYSCDSESPKERISHILRHTNETHAFLNLDCQWKTIGVFVGENEN